MLFTPCSQPATVRCASERRAVAGFHHFPQTWEMAGPRWHPATQLSHVGTPVGIEELTRPHATI